MESRNTAAESRYVSKDQKERKKKGISPNP